MSIESTMTPQWATEKASEIIGQHGTDEARTHIELDDLLCAILRSLGYGELIDRYEEQERWFE